MPEPIATYRTRVRGLWNTRHAIESATGETVGVRTIQRKGRGVVVRGRYQPA